MPGPAPLEQTPAAGGDAAPLAPSTGLTEAELNELTELFEYSPEPKSEGEPAGVQPSGTPTVVAGAEAGDGISPPAPASDPAPAPVVPAPAAEPDPITPEMRLAAMQAEIEALKAERAAPVAPAAPAAPSSAPAGMEALSAEEFAAPLTAYQFPASIRQSLIDGEPEQMVATIEQVIVGLTNHTKQYSLEAARRAVDAYHADQTAVTTTATITAEQQEKAAVFRTAYYADFPQHNRPLFQAVVQSEAARLVLELPQHPWDDNLRRALGARVTAAIKASGVALDAGQPVPAVAAPALGVNPTPTATTNMARADFDAELAEMFSDN